MTPPHSGRPVAAKASTGIEGLDDILGSGFPRDRLYLIQGDPGVGKTTLALQFLLEGAGQGERCLYITLSETREELLAVAASHGWSLDAISVFELPFAEGMTGDDDNTLFHPSEVELAELTKSLLDEIERTRPTRVVFDSLSEIRLLAQSPLRYRRQILALKQYFVGRACTVLLLDDRTSDGSDLHLQSVVHGVIACEQLSPLYGAERRRLRVIKMRGIRFRGGYHDFIIETGGMKVFPRLVAAEHREPRAHSRLACNVAALDALVGGGLDFGSSTLFMGPAGTGKSTVVLQYVHAAASSGHKAVIFSFDENLTVLRNRASTVGLDLAPLVASGQLQLRQIDPAELAPGEFAHTVRKLVENEDVRVVVIDSLNGYLHAMPEEQFLILQLHELLSFLGQKGALTLMIMAQHGFVGASMDSPVDVSYLADSVLVFRHFEIEGRLCKAVSMLKKRTGTHEPNIRELTISTQGIRVGEPLGSLHGVFTGLPARMAGGPGRET